MRQLCICLLVMLLIFAYPAIAERTVYADQRGIPVFMENGKLGLVDSSGNVLLSAEYYDIDLFGDSQWAELRQGNQCGAVCRDGRVVVECAWDDGVYIIPEAGMAVASFDSGNQICEVLIDLHTGTVLSSEPKHIYWADEKYVYDLSLEYYDGWEAIGPYQLVICDFSLNPLLSLDDVGDAEPFDGGFVVSSEHFSWNPGTCWIIDREGHMLLDDIKEYEITAEGVYYVRYGSTESDSHTYCGLISAEGVVLEVEGTEIGAKDDAGLYCINTGKRSWYQDVSGCFGYIASSGAWVIEPKYEYAGPFVEETAIVREDGRYHLIDLNGSKIGDLEWSKKTCMTLPIIPVDTDEGLMLFDRHGSPLSEEIFDLYQDVYGGMLLMRDKAGRLCVIGTDGAVLLRIEAEDQKTDMGDGSTLWIKTGGLWGLMELRGSLTGQWRISPCFISVYQYTADPEEPVYATFEDGGKAYIDPNGNPYGPYRYTKNKH